MANNRDIRRIINTKQDSLESVGNLSINSMADGQVSIAKSTNELLSIRKKKYGRIYKSYMSSDGNEVVDKNLNVGNNIIISGNSTVSGTSTFSGIVDITNTTDSSDDSGDTGALRVEGGVSIAKKLYVGTDLDIDGTTNLDAVDIDGNVQLDGTLTVGVDDTGKDVKFFGATSGKYMEWDESADSLVVSGNIDLNGDIDISGTISAAEIYQHTGNTGTKITFGTNTVSLFSAHSNAGGNVGLNVNSEGVIVNNVGHPTIDFRVESDSLTKCLYVDSSYNSVQVGGGSALQGSPSGGMFIHNGTTPSAHTDNAVFIGAKDTTSDTSNDGSTLSLFCEASVDTSSNPSSLNNFNARIAVHINGVEYWLWLQDPNP